MDRKKDSEKCVLGPMKENVIYEQCIFYGFLAASFAVVLKIS